MYVCMYVCVYIYIYTHVERERERETYIHVSYVCIYIYIYIYTHTNCIYTYYNVLQLLVGVEQKHLGKAEAIEFRACLFLHVYTFDLHVLLVILFNRLFDLSNRIK